MTSLPALLSPAELATRLDEPGLIVLDIRSAVDGGGRAAYEAGHVPGAVHTDYVAGGWRAKLGGGAGMLPEPADLGRLLGGLGITPATRVVVAPAGVSAGDFAAASRVYWTIKAAGHTLVSMLDGGTAAWVASGRPVETKERPPVSAGPYPVAPVAALRATLAEVEVAVASGGTTLVDTRNAASFQGDEVSPAAARGGRLPGAVHQEGALAFDKALGGLRPRAELAALFGALPEGDVIAYCNTGQQAATNWFVLSEVLGRRDVRLYDGSLSEWTADPGRPVETGPARES